MVLEKQIVPFLQWLPGSLLLFLALMLGLGFLALLTGYLLTAIRSGPGDAVRIVSRVLSAAYDDLRQLSARRILAMTRLAVQESLRRYVLIVFAVFAVILLFAGWYLDVESDNPGRLYISFVLKTTNFLVILLAIFLSAFSLPTDMKNRTIYTVVTKPVRSWEIILGRIFGFGAIGTVIIVVMCLISYLFVLRGLQHEHTNDVASLRPREQQAGWAGRTSRDSHHRHEFTLQEDGQGKTDAVMGHIHGVSAIGSEQTPPEVRVSGARGATQARVPVYGRLEFFDRQGLPADKGINIGKEWTYRGYVEGGTLAAGVWHFDNLKSREFLGGLPLEMTIRVFRTYKGEIERGILGSMEIRNPNPALQSDNPADLAKLDPDTAVKSRAISFTAQEFTPESRTIPRRIEAQMLDGTWRKVDLFESLAYNGALDILVRCDEKAQYYGMAQTDLYLRAADNWFWANFAKSYFTIWLQMIIVTSFGVMFSTFLTGSVAMLATLATIVMGYFSQAIVDVATGEAPGGGPAESAIRIFRQDNLTSPLEGGISTIVVKAFDLVAMIVMRGVSFLMPNFRDFAEYGGINTARFVAYGFDIPANLMWQHVLLTMAYVLIATCVGYFFLKTKEIAA